MTIDSRFGFYLIPPYDISRGVAQIHSLLRKQYGFMAADAFQVHCTIKGFFKKTDIPISKIIDELEAFLSIQKPIKVIINGFRINNLGIGLNLSMDGDGLNDQLLAFCESIVDVIRPFIAPDCDFVARDLGNPFRAHITLAFKDIPHEMYDEVLLWLDGASVPSGSFFAATFHFLEFYSHDWKGPWWQTLTWKLHKSWQI